VDSIDSKPRLLVIIVVLFVVVCLVVDSIFTFNTCHQARMLASYLKVRQRCAVPALNFIGHRIGIIRSHVTQSFLHLRYLRYLPYLKALRRQEYWQSTPPIVCQKETRLIFICQTSTRNSQHTNPFQFLSANIVAMSRKAPKGEYIETVSLPLPYLFPAFSSLLDLSLTCRQF
jgi:hypothetical protein